MSILSDIDWLPHYTPDHGDLVRNFYVPALECATRYDRTTGYFTASALALAMRGLEGLIVNGGHMRLLVGCTLSDAEVEAIEKGQSLKDTIEAQLAAMPLVPPDKAAAEALELLSWMIAKGYLEVKVSVPCNAARQPVPGVGLFHAKAGIIEDKSGNRLAFNGSINETEAGWRRNYETFHVYTSWDGGERHVNAEEREFQALWNDRSKHVLVLEVPAAKKDELLSFLPHDDRPARLVRMGGGDVPSLDTGEADGAGATGSDGLDPRRGVWSFLRIAPTLSEIGDRVGEATSAITPWPHQVRAFERMYHHWPPRLLIADEVGLGKTIQAGLILRQAWMAGKAKRILVMAPKAVLRQWQIELREKFNLNWPIYDGQKLAWCPSPSLGKEPVRLVARDAWHKEPCVIVSSHLMRRSDRAGEMLAAEPWDLIILDEAHHARRRSGGLGTDDRPNQLLRVMRQVRSRTKGLVLLTATPMQVSPVEVWDLLDLLGVPDGWQLDAFLKFFEVAAKPNPSHEEMAYLARMFRSVESQFGEMSMEEAQLVTGIESRIRLKRLLRALRDPGMTPLRQLETTDRHPILRLLRASTPVRRLISRHTRRLLRRYYDAGRISTPIATREVEDRFVSLTPAEADVYEAVEGYISTTYNNAAKEKRTAIGFVMTIYRRRLASSFHALAQTLESRKTGLDSGQGSLFGKDRFEEDLPDDDVTDEPIDVEEAEQLEKEALRMEEQGDIDDLLRAVRRLPTDTKARELLSTIMELRDNGHNQAIVFTQYTDTLEFLREYLAQESSLSVMCFSGRGGEIRSTDGKWMTISRDKTKDMFRKKAANVLICTDAAAEGLNFQFCGALVNYDMPWNPMRVEQRIGRIDRLGQQFPRIRIVNLHYRNTVEADVYVALRNRIALFEEFVGGLQPILSRLPKAIRDVTLAQAQDRDRETAALVDGLSREVEGGAQLSFDLDEITEGDVEEKPRSAPAYDLKDLGHILRQSSLMPPGDEAVSLGAKDLSYRRPGMKEAIRVTTDADFFEQHADSVELWSPGAPVFPDAGELGNDDHVTLQQFRQFLAR